MIRYVIVALWVLSLLCARPVQAQTSVVVVVPHTGTPDYDAYEHRLRSELVAEGLQPITVESLVEVNAPVLKKHANRLTSPAAIGLSVHDGVVSGLVWIEARGKYPDSTRSIPEYPLGAQAPSIFAVRATDVLHGAMLEMGYVGNAPEGVALPPRSSETASNPSVSVAPKAKIAGGTQPSPSVTRKTTALRAIQETEPAVERPEASTEKSEPQVRVDPDRESTPTAWQVRTEASLAMPFADFTWTYGVNIAVLRRLHRSWRLGASGTLLAPITSASSSADTPGQAKVTQAFGGLRLETVQSVSASTSFFEFAEVGAHSVFVSGRAPRPEFENRAYSTTGYLSAGLGATWTFARHFSAVAQTGLLVPWKGADVLVGEVTVAKAARAEMLFNAGLQLGF